jgi:hypothetical protein
MSAVIGRLARFMTRHCQIAIAIAEHWDTPFHLDEYCLHELKFWQDNIVNLNEKICLPKQFHHRVVYSDASQYACGAYIEGKENMICHRMFKNEEKKSEFNTPGATCHTIQSRMLCQYISQF